MTGGANGSGPQDSAVTVGNGCSDRDPRGRVVRGPSTPGSVLDQGSPYLAVRFQLNNGYYRGTMPQHLRPHPVEDSRHRFYLHRAVLYDAIGAGPHGCQWCEWEGLQWGLGSQDVDNLVVDHVDHDRSNNRRSNLVPTHAWCNNNRGIIESRVLGWHRFKAIPPADRPELRDVHSGAAQNLTHVGVPTAPPTAKRQKREPLRDGLVAWSDLVDLDALNCTGEVRLMPPPAALVEQFPQLRRLRR